MAIYRLEMSIVQRSKGESAVASAAYRSASKISDQRTGRLHDFSRKRGVIATFIQGPGNHPSLREELWNRAEAAEKRKDAGVAREYVVSLPFELTNEQRFDLVNRFASQLVSRYSVVVDAAIHDPSHEGDQRNAHAHLLTSMRVWKGDQFGERLAALASPKIAEAEVKSIRNLWELLVNEALHNAGCEQRVSALPLTAQRHLALEASARASTEFERRNARMRAAQFDRQPEPKLGPAVTRRDLISARKNDARQSDLAANVRSIRQVRRALKNLAMAKAESDSARITLNSLRIDLHFTNFVTALMSRFRRAIRRLNQSGNDITSQRIDRALHRVNLRLKSSAQRKIPATHLAQISKELSAFNQSLKAKNKSSSPMPNMASDSPISAPSRGFSRVRTVNER